MTVLAPSDLEVIEVTGDDRVSYLDNVTTQRLDDARPGEVRGALVLDAHGTPLAQFWVLVLTDRLFLLAPPAAAAHVLEVLATRTFLADARFERVDHPVSAVRGDVAGALRTLGLTVPEGRWIPFEDGMLAHHPFGLEIVGGAAAASFQQRVAAHDGEFERARIAAGEPRFGHEVVSGRLPEEYGLLPTHVHLAKGCYPGQEAVARMWMLGRPRRRLARVALRGTVVAGDQAGSGKQAVEVTSVAEGAGLAYVPVGATVGDVLEVGDGAIEIRGFVGADREPPGADPSVPRRRDQRPATS